MIWIPAGLMTDIDGNNYQIVDIGNQTWMTENLKVTHYRNGDPIPNVTKSTEWTNLKTGAYCAYKNIESYADTYGYLYNWFAVNDSRNIAPTGWHVPTDEDWKELEMYLGMSQLQADGQDYLRGTDESGKLKEAGTTHWNSPNTGATNSSGFSALPAGYSSGSDDYFKGLGTYVGFWSATESSTIRAWRRVLYYDHSEVYRDIHSKKYGFSVRLVRD